MYVTRPLSMYKNSPEVIYDAPPDGPNSGYLVISRSNERIKALPLPQNKIIRATYGSGDSTKSANILFISVINQPLSSNRYYMIYADGEHQGLSYGSSTEEDDLETNCFCCTHVARRRPRRLNPLDPYQQFEIVVDGPRSQNIRAKSVVHNGMVTSFIRKPCDFHPSSSSKHERLELYEEALGLNSALRSRLPNFDFPLSRERTPVVVVGKWVCPFMFIREGDPKDGMEMSPFYEMTLEQRWERVFACENESRASAVAMSAVVETELVKVEGMHGVLERNEVNGVLWVWSVDGGMKSVKVGVSFMVVERMVWEEERVGWVRGNEGQVMVGKVERFEGCGWRRYGCYVLVERFVLRRIDGSLVLTYEFKHTQHMRSKWE